MRFIFLYGFIALMAAGLAAGVAHHQAWFVLSLAAGVFVLIGIYDVMQTRHAVLRNYPIIGHMRWIFESVRPEFRQYFFSSDKDERPFNRDQRSLVYQRAKNVEDRAPFGTKFEAYSQDFSFITHALAPTLHHPDSDFRVTIGAERCAKPYSASLFNISAMSFGALSANAITALNRGAKKGGFAHDTGEGSISRYHREGGGDLIWEIGTAYFGCRTNEGGFNPDTFAERAQDDQVKMIEIKLSQGAKPGHGGVLPAAKVTPEIAEARDVPLGRDVISPAGHAAFSTPLELIAFIARLRELSGGKPVGFKLCLGHPWEFMSIVKAMLKTGDGPDFIVVDGAEGGTGAAPIEFADHVGTPLAEGLGFVHATLVGAGLRDRVKIGASGKILNSFDMARVIALGADYCNSARGFMMALGCIQSLSCHTNHCPTGVATMDKGRARALVVTDKTERVFNYHRNTMAALGELLAAAGLSQPSEITRHHVHRRMGDGRVISMAERLPWIEPGALLDGRSDDSDERFTRFWAMAQADRFDPHCP